MLFSDLEEEMKEERRIYRKKVSKSAAWGRGIGEKSLRNSLDGSSRGDFALS